MFNFLISWSYFKKKINELRNLNIRKWKYIKSFIIIFSFGLRIILEPLSRMRSWLSILSYFNQKNTACFLLLNATADQKVHKQDMKSFIIKFIRSFMLTYLYQKGNENWPKI